MYVCASTSDRQTAHPRNPDTAYLRRLGHNVSACLRRSVNAWDVVNFTSTVYTRDPGQLLL